MNDDFPDYGFETNSAPATAPVPVTGTARRLAILEELTDMAMELARIARRQALRAAEEDDAALPPERSGQPARRDAMLAFARIARVVRTCVALEEQIAAGTAAEPAAVAPVTPFDWRRDSRLAVIRAAFKTAAESQYGWPGDGFRRYFQMTGLIESDAFRAALEASPDEGRVTAAIADVAAETGITIDWQRDIEAALFDLSPYRWSDRAGKDGPPAPW